jgi:replication factor C subunit 3/5
VKSKTIESILKFFRSSKIPEIYWEKYIHDIAKDIMEEQSPKRILQVRTKIYSLMTNCIPPELILKVC